MSGLKQAAKCWNDMLTNIMADLGLKQFESEECIYASKGNKLIIEAYVNDLLIISSSEQIIANFKKNFSKKVQVTDKGPLSRFVGVDSVRSEEKLEMSQLLLINEYLNSAV